MPLRSLVTRHWMVMSLGAGRRANFFRSSTQICEDNWNVEEGDWIHHLLRLLVNHLCEKASSVLRSYSFNGFAAGGGTLLEVGVQRRQTGRVFLFLVGPSALSRLLLQLPIFAFITYLASGCRGDQWDTGLVKFKALPIQCWLGFWLTGVELFPPLGWLGGRLAGHIFLLIVTLIFFNMLLVVCLCLNRWIFC